MNTLRTPILLAVLGMGSAAVQAQQAPAEGRYAHAARQEQRQADWAEHFARRQARLHDALKLSAGQESAWTAYQAAIKPAATDAQGDRATWADLPAPQRLEKRIALSRQRTAAMEARLPALNAFYSVLTAEQKAIFDQGTRGAMPGHKDLPH